MREKRFEILIFLKRRPGMSMQEFERYYEEVHVPLCLEYTGGVSRYMRRFLDPLPSAETGKLEELPFDVVTELWFDDEAVFRATLAHLSTSIMPDEVIADERKLFDRTRTRLAAVIAEHETEMSAPR